MLRRLRKKSGQSTLEYAIVIAVIVAGLLAMQIYIRRGFQGRLREDADQMGRQFDPGGGMNYTIESKSKSRETVMNGTTRSELLQLTGPGGIGGTGEYTKTLGSEETKSFDNTWFPNATP